MAKTLIALKAGCQALVRPKDLTLLMPTRTIGNRLRARMEHLGLHPAEVARRASTSEATISNWLNDLVQPANVKATMLFNIADAVQADPREILTGTPSPTMSTAAADSMREASHDLQLDLLTLAFQLAAEVDTALQKHGKQLPPSKKAEFTKLAFELLEEGLPRAKVLRFVLAAAA